MVMKNIIVNEKVKKRFEDKVLRGTPDGCHYWIGTIDSRGYGTIIINNSKFTAHRVSYRLYKGDLNNLFVCHSCDNPLCVNPNHLFLGTHQDNMTDRNKKGRHKKCGHGRGYGGGGGFDINSTPSSHKGVKLCKISALIIKDAFQHGFNKTRIAKYFNVDDKTIRQVIAGKSWLL